MGVARVFQSIIVTSISSSPMSFGVGGSPRFATQVIVHHSVRRGVISLNPRVTERVRVPFRSYSSFARQNSAEEMSPWAIISVSAPFVPHRDREKAPEATILMCPTEE